RRKCKPSTPEYRLNCGTRPLPCALEEQSPAESLSYFLGAYRFIRCFVIHKQVDGELLRIFGSRLRTTRQRRKVHGGDQPLTLLFRDGQGEIEGKCELFPALFPVYISCR